MSTVMTVTNPQTRDAGPFRSPRETNGELYVTACKGAPDVVMGLCLQYQRVTGEVAAFTEEVRFHVHAANKAMASDALRVIAVAYRVNQAPPEAITPENVENNLVFLGLFGIIDPARPEVVPAIDRARRAGIRTIMITGDYPDTAAAIGQTIGLLEPGHRVMSGGELDRLDPSALVSALETTDALRARQSRTQSAHRGGAQAERRSRGHDRGRRERRSRAQTCGYRHRHGYYRDGRGQRDRRHGAHRRQLCEHRGSGGTGPDHLREHPQIRIFPALLQRSRDHDHLRSHRVRPAQSSHGDSALVAQHGDGRRPCPGPG